MIPDPKQKCEIIEADWKRISNQGFGYFIERGIIETKTLPNGNHYLNILSVPDYVWPNNVMDDIENLIKDNKIVQITDIQDHSTDDQLDIRIFLKPGTDPEYVRQIIYKKTSMQDSKRINMQCVFRDGPMLEIKKIGYKAYIVNFINFRRDIKFRLYNARLQKVETRLHTIETYIKILESGDVEGIIRAIRNRSQTDEAALIQWLMNKLKITDVQAKFVLNTQLKHLSRGSLNQYKAEQKEKQALVGEYIKYITHPELIDKEIEDELLYIRNKYGKPRQSVIISKSETENIPTGTFQVTVYDDNTVKKTAIGEPIKVIKGVNPKCVCKGDNSKDILLFDEMGKVFKLAISKVPLSDRNSVGTDIRTILKRLTSNIISGIYLPIVEDLADKRAKHQLIVCSRGGLIKRIDLDDIINTTPSGVIYSKLNKSDFVCDVVIANTNSDVIIYTRNKALRISISNIPYLKRSALGNIGIRSTEPVEGITVVNKDSTDIVVVTANGRFNRVSQSVIPTTSTNRAGSRIIKLSKDDSIVGVYVCGSSSVIRCFHMDGSFTDVNTSSIDSGSSISPGILLTKNVIKANIIQL